MRPGSNRELRILSGVAELLGGETDLREALERTLALVAGFLGLRTGWIWLVDPDTQQFYIAAAYRLPPYLRAPVRMAGTWCQCTDALRQGELRARNVDVIECTRLLPAVKRRRTDLTQGLRYHATIPLYFRDRPLGVMNLTDRSWRELSRDELRLLSTVALQISTALERARLAEAATGAARADERTRIARELHDTIAQRFTAIALQLEGALKGSAPSEGRSPAKIERALELARDGVEEARRSLFDLRSAPPAGKPLAQALAALVRAFTAETGIPVRLRERAGAPLPVRAEAELYRIAGEALANVRAHAVATGVELRLRTTARTVSLTVRDDGIGIAAGAASAARAARRRTGQGIVGMQERARLLGGSVTVERATPTGTLVTAKIPLGERRV